MTCPAWLRDLQGGARALVDSGAVDVLAAVEVAFGTLSAATLNPIGAVGLAAPGAFVLRWVADGCGPIDGAFRGQMALAHDYLLVEGLLWAVAGTAVVGTTTVTAPIIGTIGSAALVSAVGAMFAAAAAVAKFLATGSAPSSFEAALVPLTPLGRYAIEPAIWAASVAGFDVDNVRAAMRTQRVRNAVQRSQTEGNMANGNTGPILMWSPATNVPTAPPPAGSTATATGATLSYAYQRAYLSAARATWRQTPNADLRPWVVVQTQWDLEYLESRFQVVASTAPGNAAFQRMRAALQMLANWQKSALPPEVGGLNAAGAWSPATTSRLLLQQGRIDGIIPDGVSGDSGGGVGGGGGAAVGLGVLGLLAYLWAR